MTPTRAVLAPTLAAIPLLALAVGLGTWQLQRKAEKEALIDAVETRAKGPATTIPAPGAWPGLDPDRIDFQKVAVEGTFRAGPEFRLYAALTQANGPLRGPGWFVYQPFDLANGGTILVNRGFVPDGLRESGARPTTARAPEGPTRIEGLVRRVERAGWFAPVDSPDRNQWFLRDPLKMAAHAGLGPVAPFTLEQSSPNPGGLPQAGETRLVFPNRHLEYAGTWFGLGATLVGVWAVFVRRRLVLAMADR
jgi:surfeit locus 1 family protein